MAYYILEIDPQFVGDDSYLKDYLRDFSASDVINLRKNTSGSQEQVLVELLNCSVQPGLYIIDGPMDADGAISYLDTNNW